MGNKILATVVFSSVLVLVLGGASPTTVRSEQAAEHPEFEGAGECVECHAEPGMTPLVVEEWYASKHGKFLVKCNVCHGSIGEDFTSTPPIERCVGCHSEQVDSMGEPIMKDKTCFSCHTKHGFLSHMVSARDGGQR